MDTQTRKVVCLRTGDKYGVEYVNKLYHSVVRCLSLDHAFTCITDDPTGLDSGIDVKKVREGFEDKGWWGKLTLFADDNDYELGDTNLFLDLDVVIISNIDELFTHRPEQPVMGIRDFFFPQKYINSSVLRWDKGQLSEVWDRFRGSERLSDGRYRVRGRVYGGDQDLLSESITGGQVYPDTWVQSWKLTKGNVAGDTKIVAFHGKPDPHEVDHPLVSKHWKG